WRPWSRYIRSSAGSVNPSGTHTASRSSCSSCSDGATGTGRLWKWYRARCSESPKDRTGEGRPGTLSSYWKRYLAGHVSYVSLLDGASRIAALFERAAQESMPALAMTDHGAMFGALNFYEAGRAAGVKPILGVEAYVAPGSRFDRTPGEDAEKYRHLTILARNEAGYRNLLKLVTDAHIDGFYHRPRIDKELLAERADGLIGLSGCLASEIARFAVSGQDQRTLDAAATFRDIFGPD